MILRLFAVYVSGFRSRDSSVSSVQSVQSVQSAYSGGDGRRRRRRRRKSSGGSQRGPGSRGGSMEHINIQVTCGGQGNRREVKMDEYGRRSSCLYSRQNSAEGQNRSGKGENWRERGYYGDESDRGQHRGGRGRGGFDRRGQYDDGYARDEGQGRPGKDRQRQDSGANKVRGHYGQRGRDAHADLQDNRTKNFHGKEPFDRQKGLRHEGQDKREEHVRGPDRRDEQSRGRGKRDEQLRGPSDRRDEQSRGQNRRDEQSRGPDRRDEQSRGQNRRDEQSRGQRDNRGRFSQTRETRDESGRHNDQERKQSQPETRGGLIHLPVPHAQTQHTDLQYQISQSNSPPGPNNNWSRGHTPDKIQGPGQGRERQHSGPNHRQKTLYDPNNPSQPIVIEEAKPKLEFKETDSYPSSPQSPHYMGNGPPPQELYNHGFRAPFCPPGYAYGYNMPAPHPAMMPMARPPGMFYGYQGPLPPPPQFRGAEEMYEAYLQG